MRRRNEQAEQRFRLTWRMGVKKVCDESSDTAQKHGDAANSQFGAVHCGRMQFHEAGLYLPNLHQLLGLPIQQQDATGADLGIGNGFLGIGQTATGQNQRSTISASASRASDIQKATASLKERGIQPEVLHGVQLYFRDPDGIRVQLSAPDYVYQPS